MFHVHGTGFRGSHRAYALSAILGMFWVRFPCVLGLGILDLRFSDEEFLASSISPTSQHFGI